MQDSQPGIAIGVAVLQLILPPDPALNTGSLHEATTVPQGTEGAGVQPPTNPPARRKNEENTNNVIKIKIFVFILRFIDRWIFIFE
jgi:hypothetical protein